jgi:hypothetical protein
MKILGIQLGCKHEWTNHGWSFVKCKKCKKVRIDVELNKKLLSEKLERMYGNTPELIQMAKMELYKRGRL